MAILSPMVLLAYIGSQTMPLQSKSKAYKEPSSIEITLPDIPIETSTTTTSIEVTTTVPETTTTEPYVETTVTTQYVPKTTTTKPYVDTTTPKVIISGTDGPPHNTTTLIGCISWYESNWGADPNVFQFTQGTWEAYGGTGSPSNASYSVQEAIFWLAWADDGPHHWAAQKGRCF